LINPHQIEEVRMNEAREILHQLLIKACVHCDEETEAQKALDEYNENVDTALKQLRELVEGKKQKEPEMDWGGRTYEEQIEPARISGYNSACDDIADMIYKEEK
jgi:hypothetical protein